MIPVRRAETIVILGALTAFAPMSIDMYLPAFPALQTAFGTGPGPIQLTLAAFFVSSPAAR
jgi:DHA1 family bicyclomycin/chloramphenicol resistance-like MFS transporter